LTAISKKIISFSRKIFSIRFYAVVAVCLWLAILVSGNYHEPKEMEMIEIDGYEIEKEKFLGGSKL